MFVDGLVVVVVVCCCKFPNSHHSLDHASISSHVDFFSHRTGLGEWCGTSLAARVREHGTRVVLFLVFLSRSQGFLAGGVISSSMSIACPLTI